ncbi:MAG: chorismate--pyruvate lyase family protein [Francisellaceae bacterium]
MKEIWLPEKQNAMILPEDVKFWLLKVKRLGLALSAQFESPSIKELATFEATVPHRVAHMLEPDETKARIRLIGHFCKDKPVVLARVVIPDHTYKKYQAIFDHLGNRSIGETFLFRRDTIERGDFYIGRLDAVECRQIFKQHISKTLWGRMSVFTIDNHYPLSIEEYFCFLPVES